MMLLPVILFHCFTLAKVETSGIDPALRINYEKQKNQINVIDQKSRSVMSTLYDINMRMKGINRKRSGLDNRMLGIEYKVKSLTRETLALEAQIKEQTSFLSKRLRFIYTLGEQTVPYILFSSADQHELDQNIKYLNLISKQDLTLLKDYEQNLKKRITKRESLKKEITKLIKIKNRLKEFENNLSADQQTKAQILSMLDAEKKKSLGQIQIIKENAEKNNFLSELNLSFYEHKGQLSPPTEAPILKNYGIVENSKFLYKLGHKGITFQTSEGSLIRSIHHARVAFLGEIPGYGKSIILDHGDHYYSVYSKILEPLVVENSSIQRAQNIAKAGANFYFEIRHFSETVNPEAWIKRQ